MNEYPLQEWHSSELLKEAAEHLRDQPEYVPMNPEARAEMTRFCHAVRRKLMIIQELSLEYRRAVLEGVCTIYGLDITTADYFRYQAHVHGYLFTIIMDIPSKEAD